MLKVILRVFFVCVLFLTVLEQRAQAYIDPGSGGYLIASLLAWIGGALAFGAAFLIHFFKFTFKNFAIKLWTKHRITAIILILLILSGLIWGGYYLFKPSPQKKGGLVATPVPLSAVTL